MQFRRSTLIVLLLVATLGMTAMLAYEAHQSARSHRATAENVLRDYASFAAWELSRTGRQQLLNVITSELHEVQQAASGGRLSGVVANTHHCSTCGVVHRMRSAFHTPLPDVRFTFAGEPVDPAILTMLEASIRDGRRKPDEFTCPTLRPMSIDGSTSIVVWRPLFDRSDKPIGVAGFVSDPEFVATVFQKLLKNNSLLPPSLVADGTNPNAALVVRVADREGRQLFASPGDWSKYVGEQRLQNDLGGLVLSVALKPDAAGVLVIGGLPRERLPLVVGLLTLTAGLVVVALVQLRREAELSRLRSDFVSGVSHELRTPLAQIRMFSETLLLGRVRSELEGRRSLEIIARETERLGQLVENILFFSRSERRKPQIARESVRMAPILSEVVESFAPLAAGRHVRIATTLDQTIVANVDAGAMRQILLNLLDNAVKYGPEGQMVAVSLALNGDRVRLSVEDEGGGVDPRDSERIWQPFNRLPHAAAATGGAGIGLAIVRQLTDLHGGRAWVERGAIGARFVIELTGAWAEQGAAAAVA